MQVAISEVDAMRLEQLFRKLDDAVRSCWAPLMISGLKFKTERTYLTAEGYPRGTTCWFVHCEIAGDIKYACGDTPEQAIVAATEWIKQWKS